MGIIRLLKRKDASSVVVAVVLGFIILQAIQFWAQRPAELIVNSNSNATSLGIGGWKGNFWFPLALFVIELIILELLIWVYVFLSKGVKSSKK